MLDEVSDGVIKVCEWFNALFGLVLRVSEG